MSNTLRFKALFGDYNYIGNFPNLNNNQYYTYGTLCLFKKHKAQIVRFNARQLYAVVDPDLARRFEDEGRLLVVRFQRFRLVVIYS